MYKLIRLTKINNSVSCYFHTRSFWHSHPVAQRIKMFTLTIKIKASGNSADDSIVVTIRLILKRNIITIWEIYILSRGNAILIDIFKVFVSITNLRCNKEKSKKKKKKEKTFVILMLSFLKHFIKVLFQDIFIPILLLTLREDFSKAATIVCVSSNSTF